ncbi:MAG: PPC domain-containing DNA-binding protein [Bacillota bacterium]
MLRAVEKGRTFVGRLQKGDDLLIALGEICSKEKIVLGEVRAIGALSKARISYYNQKQRSYETIEFPEATELVALVGNISLKEGAPFIHAHVTLADEEGRAFGGHLVNGCEVFACEFVIQELISAMTFERGMDEDTWLALWRRE